MAAGGVPLTGETFESFMSPSKGLDGCGTHGDPVTYLCMIMNRFHAQGVEIYFGGGLCYILNLMLRRA